MVVTRAPATLAVTIVTLVVCTAFVFFRFLTRIWIVRRVQIDDWLILAAWIVAVGFSVSICIGTAFGLGRHTQDIPVAWEVSLRKAQFAFSVLYNPALMLTKTSILAFFLAVSKDDIFFRWCNYLTLTAVNVAGLALTFLNIFQCRPVSAGFVYPTPQNANCIDIVTLYLSSAPVNIVTDLAILFLPMPTLTAMRLPRKQKIILVVTFSFGVFVTVVDIVRIAYLENAALSRLQSLGSKSQNSRIVEQYNFPWYASLSFMWSAVEVNVGIVCACVPSLKPLFLRFLPSFIKDANDVTTMGGSLDTAPKASDDLADVDIGEKMLKNPAALKQPSAAEYRGGEGEDEMGFLDFLAGPVEDAPMARTSTNISRFSRFSRAKGRKSTSTDFDFYRVNKTRAMVKLSNRESFGPVAVVTILFFLWGFAYGLLDVLNSQFETIATLSSAESLGLHAAYYGGYFVGPLTLGRFILKRYGFKASMITGLCVYSCGTLVFWPSAVLTSYTAFVISNFIVGFGLSCLEIAANPFIALCGPLEYAEVRLNFSQGFQAIGTVVSPLLAQKVFFKNVQDAPSLVNVQWTYLGIALFDVVLAVLFYYVPLPEASDDDLEALVDRHSATYRTQVGSVPVVWLTLGLGAFSQFCYVGGQEAIGSNTAPLARLLHPGGRLTPFDYSTVGHTVFAIGRFLSAFLNYVLKPRWILLFSYVGLILSCALQMHLGSNAGMAVHMLIYFFESGVFSIIFAISMRGMGRHTKTASSLVTAAISGGALFSPIQTVVARHHGLQYSFCVPLAAFVLGTVFAIYLNVVPAARKQVDPVHERRERRRHDRRVLRNESITSDMTTTKNQFGLAGILARRRKGKAEEPSSQHIERLNQPSRSIHSITPPLSNENVAMPRSPSPVRRTSSIGQSHDFARHLSRDVSRDLSREEQDGLDTLGHGLAPWVDAPDDEKECEILFGKSISSAL